MKYLLSKARDTFEEHFVFLMKLAHGTSQNFPEKICPYTSYELRGWFLKKNVSLRKALVSEFAERPSWRFATRSKK